MPTLDEKELSSFLGFSLPFDEAPMVASHVPASGSAELDVFLGFRDREERPPIRRRPSRELTEEERASVIKSVTEGEPVGLYEAYARETLPGLTARAIARGVYGEDYAEAPVRDYGWAGNQAVGLASFVGDPVNLVLGVVGKTVGQFVLKGLLKAFGEKAVVKGLEGLSAEAIKKLGPGGVERLVRKAAAEKLGTYGASAVEKGTSAGTFLGGHGVASDTLRQYAETGEVDPVQVLKTGGIQTLTGLALGPAAALGGVPAGATLAQRAVGAGKAIPAEILAFATVPAALEGRLPTLEDLGGATFAVVGIRGVHLSLSGLLKLGQLGKKETAPSRKEFEDATGLDARDYPAETRMRAAKSAMGRAERIRAAFQEAEDAEAGIYTIPKREPVGPGGEVPPGAMPVREISDAKGQVSDVRGVEGGRGVEGEGRENLERGGEAGAAVAPKEAESKVAEPDPLEAEIVGLYQAAKGAETAKADVKRARRQGRDATRVAERDLQKIAEQFSDLLPDEEAMEAAAQQRAGGFDPAQGERAGEQLRRSGYSFRDTKEGRSAANELRDGLPAKLGKTAVTIVKEGEPGYQAADGADIMGYIGADEMADAIQFYAGRRGKGLGRYRPEYLADFIDRNPEQFPAGSEGWSAAQRYRVARATKGDVEAPKARQELEPVAVDRMAVGDTFTIGGESYRVKTIDPDTGEIAFEGGRPLTMRAGEDLSVDAGSYKSQEWSTEFEPEPAKPAPSVEAKPAVKEPWEMTKAEWLGKLGKKKGEAAGLLADSLRDSHKRRVAKAFAEGKPVPARVLAEYPDLKPTLGERAEAAQSEADILAEKLSRRPLAAGVDPKIAAKVIEWAVKQLQATGLRYADLATRAIKAFGAEAYKDFEPILREEFAKLQESLKERPAALSAPATPPSAPPTSPESEAQWETGLRNEILDRKRQERGLPPVETLATLTTPERWAEADQRLRDNPNAGYELVADAKENPRGLDVRGEEPLLLRHLAQTELRIERVSGEIEEAQRANRPEPVELIAEQRALAEQLSAIEEVSKASGSSAGRSLQFRQMVTSDSFNLSRMLMKERTDRGRALEPEEIAKIKTLSEALAKAEADYQREFARAEQLEIEQMLDERIGKTTERFTKRQSKRAEGAKAKIDAAWETAIAASKGKLFSIERIPFDKELRDAYLGLARAYVEAGIVRLGDFLDRARGRLGDRFDKARELLREVWSEAIAEQRPERPTRFGSAGELTAYARQLEDYFLETGLRGREAITKAVWGELEKAIPGFTERQTQEALAGVGTYQPATKDELKLEKYDVNRQLQEIVKVKYMEESGQAGPKFGSGRPDPTDEQRRLIQKTNETKRRLDIQPTDPETQSRSILQSMKTRLRNKISDRRLEKEKRERIVTRRGKSTRTDPELEALRREAEIVDREWREVFGDPRLSDAQREKIALAAVERSITEYDKMIRTGNVAPKGKAEPFSTERLETRRSYRDALKAEVKELRELRNPKKTPEERATLAAESALRRKIAQYDEMLAKGQADPDYDYAFPAKKPVRLSPKLEFLRRTAEKKREDILEHQRRVEQQNKTLTRKIAEYSGGVAFQLSRGLAFGLDVSFLGLQGKAFQLSHPKRFAGHLESMLAAWSSKDGASRAAYELSQRPRYKSGEFKRAGVDFTDPHGKLSRQEEGAISFWIAQIPILRNFQRAWSTFLNNTRADFYEIIAESSARRAAKKGQAKLTLEQEKAIGKAVNIFTGRGSFGKGKIGKSFTLATEALNMVFLAPKYVLSRFQMILGAPVHLVRAAMGDVVSQAILVEYGRMAVSFAAIHSLMYAGLYATFGPPGDYWEMNFDPSSDKKMGVRIGARTLDTSGGIFSALRFMTRMGIGLIRYEPWMERAELERPYDEFLTYGRGKLAPWPGAGASRFRGTTMESRTDHPVPATVGNLARGLVEPINVSDIAESMGAYGMPYEKALGILNLFGENVRTDQYNQRMYERQYQRQMKRKEAG